MKEHKLYRLIIQKNNVQHAPWYHSLPKYDSWNGNPVYEFDTVQECINFIRHNMPCDLVSINMILQNDKRKSVGTLCCINRYEVKKGADQMTEYTSF